MRATLLLAGIIGLHAFGGASPPQAARPPNIVLIISDDHAWSDYGFMRHPVVRTPSLDALAAESRVFTRGYVPTALCRPSLATLATGLYPHQHGVTGNDPPGGRAAMMDPAARATMVEVFRRNRSLPALLAARGYVSFQSGKWWEGRPQEFGFSAAMTHGDVTRGGRHGDEGLKIGRQGVEPITDFIDAAGGAPFFVWYAPFLPHTPHDPPERLLEKYRQADRPLPVARYYAMIEWLDETVGGLLRHLDAKGLRENTIVVYVADNGWIQAPEPKPLEPTRAKMSPYDAGIRTPILLRWPGRVQAARDDRTLAGTIDLVPTLLRAAGVEAPPGLPGLDLLDDRALARRRALFGALFAHTAVDVTKPAANLKYRYVVRTDGWKLVLPHAPNREVTLMIDGRTADWMRFEPELYDLTSDPYEEKNLAAARPELVRELRAAIDGWWDVDEGGRKK